MRPSAFALALALPLLAGCAADDREPLVVYSPHGKELLADYEARFEAEHPDVDVRWLDMGSQQIYDRVRTERANPQASVWWGAPQTTFARAAAEGLLAPYAPTWADAVEPAARDSLDRWYGTYRTPEVLMFNADRLADEDRPRTWDDLLDPRWRDRLLVRYPLASGTMRTIFGAMVLRQPTVEDGLRWLARLDENTRAYTADPTQLYLRLARGEGDLTLWNMPDVYIQREEGGYPFGYVLPADGTPVLVDGIAVVDGAPAPERARQFYEFVTSQEALIDQARRNYRIPARTDLPADSLPGWMHDDAIVPMPLDWERLEREGPEWMRIWDERIKGRGAAYLAETA
jgi:iron(III) transport system substrate-binding protein